MKKTAYEVFESIHGAYDPDKPHDLPFSVWLSEERAEFLRQYPKERNNMIDGHFYTEALMRFMTWVVERKRS